MTHDITIPPEARMAATEAYLRTGGCIVSAIRAALAAWPGWQHRIHIEPAIILPLPQENTND